MGLPDDRSTTPSPGINIHRANVTRARFSFSLNRCSYWGFDVALTSLDPPPHRFCLLMNQPSTRVQNHVRALLKMAATTSPSLMRVLKWLLVFVSLTSAAVLRRLLVIWFKAWRSPLRALPGPKSKSLFLGNFDLRFDPENALPHERWISKYGTTFSYAGFLNVSFRVRCNRCCSNFRFKKPRLATIDVGALSYVLKHGEDYQKPEPLRYHLSKIFGAGVAHYFVPPSSHLTLPSNQAFSWLKVA